jgi:hypothetical protein
MEKGRLIEKSFIDNIADKKRLTFWGNPVMIEMSGKF